MKTVVMLVFCVSFSFLAVGQSNSSRTQSEFVRQARELAKCERLKVEPVLLVARLRPGPQPWRPNMVTIVFWIGEGGNDGGAWDPQWKNHYGGVDDPDSSKRRNFIPVSFVPRLNPFYCALPYNDVVFGQFKPEAPLVIPWFKRVYQEPGKSVCQNHWMAIRKTDLSSEGKPDRVCYAQWSDCGPFVTNNFQYVFGDDRPRPNANHGAGLNVSPAVRDFLGLSSTDMTDWQFVEVRDVPPGPWRSYGSNNHFVEPRRQHEIIAPDFHRLPGDVRL